jgi:hypothetical protein
MDPRAWVRRFFCGSILFKKGLHHVLCIRLATLDDGLSRSGAATDIKIHPYQALGFAVFGSHGRQAIAQYLASDQPGG